MHSYKFIYVLNIFDSCFKNEINSVHFIYLLTYKDPVCMKSSSWYTAITVEKHSQTIVAGVVALVLVVPYFVQ